jgi:hypothetical protein
MNLGGFGSELKTFDEFEVRNSKIETMLSNTDSCEYFKIETAYFSNDPPMNFF